MAMLKSFHTAGVTEAGCDEAGRGCIAGPVFAAAVILPSGFQEPRLNDSKLLSTTQRAQLRKVVEQEALAFGIGMVNEQEIDEINILNASFLAMHRALSLLKIQPGHLIIDGNRFKTFGTVSHTCIVKGDGKYASIAAASILAKTHRDEFMNGLHHDYPVYGWDRNRGYPTQAHRKALLEHGPSPHHRRSFRLLNDQLELDFS
jgi:ribonuclease HII